MNNLEMPIQAAVKKVKKDYSGHLGFFKEPLRWDGFKTIGKSSEVQAMYNDILNSNDPKLLAKGITHFADFLADQTLYIKDRISIKHYINILHQLHL